MAEDASLDDFLDAGNGSGSEGDGNGDGNGAVEDGTVETESGPADSGGSSEAVEPTPSEAVEPAATTYAWSPEGAACAECGEVVERRWIQGGVLVCGACKSW